MRWTKKIKPIKKSDPIPRVPEIGEEKIVTKFAWFPVKIGETPYAWEVNNQDKVWLEYYEIVYEYKERKYRVELPYPGICTEQGGKYLAEYKTYTIIDWFEIRKQYKS